MKFSVSRIATFGAAAIVSFFLLELFPFYPLYLAIILSLVLGALALEFPSLALLLALLLSVFAAFYQGPFMGLTFVVVFLIMMALTTNWLETALVGASWVLAFLVPSLSSLAIAPVILAGLHHARQNAFKIGALSGITLFLMGWTKGVMQAGLLLIPFPAANATFKAIPEPWRFEAFIPNVEVFNTPSLTDYYASLGVAIGDFRVYVLIALWAFAGYLIAVLASKWKGPAYVVASIVGVLPVVAVSAVLAQVSLIQLGLALVAAAVLTFAYSSLQPIISGPALGVFTGLDDLVATGIPRKYGLLLGSLACDERNVVVEQFLQSGVRKRVPCFLLTSDTGFAQSAASRFGRNLTVLVCNPRATAGAEKNFIPVPTGIQNLTALNIELVKVVKDHAETGGRVCLDVLSDILLTHKLLTTRKWVTDILPRLQNWGFTVLGVFNPGLHSNEEVQGLVELYNGYSEIFEKDYAGRARRLIAVRKMADLQYNENELLIDKQRLQRQKGGLSAIRERLAR